MRRLSRDESSLHGIPMTTKNKTRVWHALREFEFERDRSDPTVFSLRLSEDNDWLIVASNRAHDQDIIVWSDTDRRMVDIGTHDTLLDVFRCLTEWRSNGSKT